MLTQSLATVPTYDPSMVIERLFSHSHWDVPKEIIRAVMQPNSRTAVKKCHASSGTFTAADIALYSLIAGGDVLATAPTWTQVEQVLFAQAHAALRDSMIPFSEWGTVNKTEIRLPTGEFFLGLSTDVGVRFQGHHARPNAFLLIILDEAPGVRSDIYEAVEGISAGGDVRLLLLGNPVIRSGPFFEIFETMAPGWRRFTIDAFDTPNLAGLTLAELLALPEHDLEIAPRPYLVTRRWVRDRYYEWGEESSLWQSRVRGEFPDNMVNGVVLLSWVRACQRLESEPGLPVELGMDVGAGGDETNIRERRGMRAGRKWNKRTPDFGDAVAMALDAIRETGAIRIKVDSIGIGWGVVGRLRELRAEGVHDCEVVAVNVGAASFAPDRFPKLRDQLWWEVGRELSRSGGWDLTDIDETTIAQLIAPKYARDSAGRIKIEPKAETRKQLGRSPDDGDALLLCYADIRPPAIVDDVVELADDEIVEIGASF